MEPEEKKPKLDQYINLAKVVIWPLVVLIFLICYRSHLNKLVDGISNVEVGSFKLEIKRAAEEEKMTGIVSKLSNLSENSIVHFLYIGGNALPLDVIIRDNWLDAPKQGDTFQLNTDLEVFQELSKNRLIFFISAIDSTDTLNNCDVLSAMEKSNFYCAGKKHLFPYLRYDSLNPFQGYLTNVKYQLTPKSGKKIRDIHFANFI